MYNVFSAFGAKLQRIIDTTKKLGIFLIKHTQFLFLTWEFTFRGARQTRLTSYVPLRGEKPVRDDHSLLPCARGSHACLRGDDCAAEMFFSLFYPYFICCDSTIQSPKIRVSGCKITYFFLIVQVLSDFSQYFIHFSRKIRTFLPPEKVLSFEKTKKNKIFLCFLLTYSYLCTRFWEQYIIK